MSGPLTEDAYVKRQEEIITAFDAWYQKNLLTTSKDFPKDAEISFTYLIKSRLFSLDEHALPCILDTTTDLATLDDDSSGEEDFYESDCYEEEAPTKKTSFYGFLQTMLTPTEPKPTACSSSKGTGPRDIPLSATQKNLLGRLSPEYRLLISLVNVGIQLKRLYPCLENLHTKLSEPNLLEPSFQKRWDLYQSNTRQQVIFERRVKEALASTDPAKPRPSPVTIMQSKQNSPVALAGNSPSTPRETKITKGFGNTSRTISVPSRPGSTPSAADSILRPATASLDELALLEEPRLPLLPDLDRQASAPLPASPFLPFMTTMAQRATQKHLSPAPLLATRILARMPTPTAILEEPKEASAQRNPLYLNGAAALAQTSSEVDDELVLDSPLSDNDHALSSPLSSPHQQAAGDFPPFTGLTVSAPANQRMSSSNISIPHPPQTQGFRRLDAQLALGARFQQAAQSTLSATTFPEQFTPD